MSIKSDRWIRQMAIEHEMISPFETKQVRQVDGRRVISYGTSSYGYDMRLARDGFKIFSPIHGREIDPKEFDHQCLIDPPLHTADDGSEYYLLPPHTYALCVSLETFRIPSNVLAVAVGKSSLARSALFQNTTPLEPSWRGRLVIELANLADLPLRVYINEGIAQVLFYEGDEQCETTYDSREGGSKYQDQKGLTTPRV